MRPTQLSQQQYQDTILGPLNDVVHTMERRGVCIDLAVLELVKREAIDYETQKWAELADWTGKPDLNWASHKQVQAFLHGDLGLPPSPYYGKGAVQDGKVSTDAKALEWLATHAPKEHRAGLRTIIEYRRAGRVIGYAEDWAKRARNGRLYPSFGLSSDADTRAGARTGRFGVKEPPLNQVPRDPNKDRFRLRKAFTAPDGKVVVAVDASQLEVVIIAHLCSTLFGTTAMADRLRAQVDLHTLTAKYIYGEQLKDPRVLAQPAESFKKDPYCSWVRDISKQCRYGLHYMKGAQGFGSSLFDQQGEAIGTEAAQVLVDGIYGFDPELRLFHDWVREWVPKNQYISSLFGRWYPLPDGGSPRTGIRNRAIRQAANWGCQAGGQEILALALIAIDKDEELTKLGYEAVLPVHDEILGYAPESSAKEAVERVKNHIKTAVTLLAPLGASGGYGASWAEAK